MGEAMNGNGKAEGVIINPRYRRSAVLKALLGSFTDSEEGEEDEACTVIYLDHDRDPRCAEEH